MVLYLYNKDWSYKVMTEDTGFDEIFDLNSRFLAEHVIELDLPVFTCPNLTIETNCETCSKLITKAEFVVNIAKFIIFIVTFEHTS